MTDHTYHFHTDPLRDRVLGKIKQGDTRMKPRWRFVVTSVLWALAVIIFVCALVYFTSLSVFLLRESGAWLAASFGVSGWVSFLRSIPFWHIAVVATLVCALEWLLRKYALVYRRPVIGSVVAVLALAVIGGAAGESLQSQAARYVRDTNIVSFIGLPYSTITRITLAPDLFEGVVVERRDNALVIERDMPIDTADDVAVDSDEKKDDRILIEGTASDSSDKKEQPHSKRAVRDDDTKGDVTMAARVAGLSTDVTATTTIDTDGAMGTIAPSEQKEAEETTRDEDDTHIKKRDGEREEAQHTRKVRVVITPETRLPQGDTFEVGKTVIIQGRQTDTGTIEALGVRDFDR